MACPNIDGFLVGGASLLPEFVDIMKVTYLGRSLKNGVDLLNTNSIDSDP